MTVLLDNGSKGGATVITGGLHASSTNNSANGARADTLQSAGRLWFEFTNNFVSLSTDSGTGLTPSASPNYTTMAASAAGGLMIYRSGQVWLNGGVTSIGLIGGIRFDSVMCCINFGTGMFWAKTPGMADWNSVVGANPDTGVGGLDINSIIGAGLYPLGVITSLANSFDANFGASIPVNTPPSTYGPWDGSTPPPPPTPTLSAIQNARMPAFGSAATATAQSAPVGEVMLATEGTDTFAAVEAPTVGAVMLATEAPDVWDTVPPFRINVGALNAPDALVDDDVIYVLECNETIFLAPDFSSFFLIPYEETLTALPFAEV